MGLKDKLNVKVKERQEAHRKQIEENKKEFFDVIKQLFNDHPELKAIRWRQYTPYFNDGDPCTFGIGEVFAQVSGHEIGEDEGDYEDGFCSMWHLKDDTDFTEDIDSVESFMRSIKDAIEETFGNGVIVTIERDKEPYTEDFSHD